MELSEMGWSWGVVDQPWGFLSYFWPEMGRCCNSPPSLSDVFLECEQCDSNALTSSTIYLCNLWVSFPPLFMRKTDG